MALSVYKIPSQQRKKKVSQKLFLDKKKKSQGKQVASIHNQENRLKNYKFTSVVDLVSKDAEIESQSEMEKVSLFPKLGKNKNKE